MCGALLGLTPEAIGVAMVPPLETLAVSTGVFVVVLPVLYLSARKPAVWAMYPEIRARRQTRRLVRQSWIAWAVYLWGYELIFRGLLLFILVAHWGVWPALALTTALYAMAHLDKLPDETAATLPMGLVFGATALLTGGMWAPWILHTLIAGVTEWFAARAHPDMVCGDAP